MLKFSRYLLGDRDAACKQEFSKSAKRLGIHEVQAVSNLLKRFPIKRSNPGFRAEQMGGA
jgi:hypothetical protein